MTGLYNRRYFEEVLQRELSRSERAHDSLTLALFDIDHFKSFNDSFGHEAGDEVIKAGGQAAARFRALLRHRLPRRRRGAGGAAAARAPAGDLQPPRPAARAGRSHADQAQRLEPACGDGVDRRRRRRPGPGDDILRRADVALYAAKHGVATA